MTKQTRSNLLCLITAMIWGGGFIAQKAGGVLGPFTYNGPRCLLGGLFLLPIIGLSHPRAEDYRKLLQGSLTCGLLLFLASSLQQIGIGYTTTSKAGFITSLYAIIVPFLARLMGKRMPKSIWISVLLSVIGLYLLTGGGRIMHLAKGDLFVLASALLFAMQIMAIDHYAAQTDPIMLSCLQFLIAGIFGIIAMLLFEAPHLSSMMHYLPAYVYGGIISTGVGYTLQIIAQKDGHPAQCALILCLESVFSALGGMIILHERLSLISLLGCALIFAGVALSAIRGGTENES